MGRSAAYLLGHELAYREQSSRLAPFAAGMTKRFLDLKVKPPPTSFLVDSNRQGFVGGWDRRP